MRQSVINNISCYIKKYVCVCFPSYHSQSDNRHSQPYSPHVIYPFNYLGGFSPSKNYLPYITKLHPFHYINRSIYFWTILHINSQLSRRISSHFYQYLLWHLIFHKASMTKEQTLLSKSAIKRKQKQIHVQSNVNEYVWRGPDTWNSAAWSAAGLIQGLHPANERCQYKLTQSITGWGVQTHNQAWEVSLWSCIIMELYHYGVDCGKSKL